MTLELNDMTDSQKIVLLWSQMQELRNGHAKDHKVLIEGNGELPVVEKVRNLENFANTIKFWFRTIAIAIVLQTITFGAAAVVYFVKLYPLLNEIANKQP